MFQHITQPSLFQDLVPCQMFKTGDSARPSPIRERVGGPEGGTCDGIGSGAALGLSTAHISPLHLYEDPKRNITSIESPNSTLWRYTVNDNGGSARFWVGGSLVRVSRPTKNELLRVTGQVGGGGRSYISGFSPASRLRMMRLLATLRRDCVPVFLTLTYPSTWPDTPSHWKKHLDRFAKRVLRRFPGAALVWKLEAQRRGAPHFHLMLYGVYEVPDGFKGWLSLAWYEVVGSQDERHLRAGTRVEYLRSYRGAISYAAKYMDKTVEDLPEEWGRPGRFWGVIGRDNLPTGEIIDVPLTWAESVSLQRWLRRYAELPGRDRRTETIFVGNSERWLYALDAFGGSS